MTNDFQIPAAVLIAALMLAFAYLHSRFRSVRTLLWILALGCAELQAVLAGIAGQSGTSPHSTASIWLNTVGETALMLSSTLFLASLSPLSFRLGRFRILFAVPYAIPLVAYSVLYYSLHPYLTGNPQSGHAASGMWLAVYSLLAVWAAGVSFLWSLQKGAIPIWIATLLVGVGGGLCIPALIHGDAYWPLLVVQSGNMLMTALLIVYSYRRLSPGVLFATGGFIAWALPPFLLLPAYNPDSLMGFTDLVLDRAVILGKVVVAIGLILLVLEDEIEKNQAARRREHRVRLELEAYGRQSLTARSLDEFDRGATQLCAMIAQHSRFAAVALLVPSGSTGLAVAGYAGMDGATAGALDTLARRLPASSFASDALALVQDTNQAGDSPFGNEFAGIDLASIDLADEEQAVQLNRNLSLDLTPWLTPGDDLERLHLTRIGAVPMLGPDNSVEGALLLSDPRVPIETLRADDLLPLEILAGRLQAARAQAMMLGKLIESERFAGVGQMAANVAQQLNNPLTVILGYAALLEDSGLVPDDLRSAEAISVEARRMKGILGRLARFSQLSSERYNAFSLTDLVADIEQLQRPDFLRHSIEFRLSVAPALSPVFGNPNQIRQALRHAMQWAIDSVLRVGANHEKAIRVEITQEDARATVLIGHSGPPFAYSEKAFDSLSTGFSGNDATGIGLSLCAAIVREHRGNITAINTSPSGAAILIDLPIS